MYSFLRRYSSIYWKPSKVGVVVRRNLLKDDWLWILQMTEMFTPHSYLPFNKLEYIGSKPLLLINMHCTFVFIFVAWINSTVLRNLCMKAPRSETVEQTNLYWYVWYRVKLWLHYQVLGREDGKGICRTCPRVTSKGMPSTIQKEKGRAGPAPSISDSGQRERESRETVHFKSAMARGSPVWQVSTLEKKI